jgi:hypothetical protein
MLRRMPSHTAAIAYGTIPRFLPYGSGRPIITRLDAHELEGRNFPLLCL